jgi:hypothetical protein
VQPVPESAPGFLLPVPLHFRAESGPKTVARKALPGWKQKKNARPDSAPIEKIIRQAEISRLSEKASKKVLPEVLVRSLLGEAAAGMKLTETETKNLSAKIPALLGEAAAGMNLRETEKENRSVKIPALLGEAAAGMNLPETEKENHSAKIPALSVTESGHPPDHPEQEAGKEGPEMQTKNHFQRVRAATATAISQPEDLKNGIQKK